MTPMIPLPLRIRKKCHESIKGPDYKKNMHKYVKKKIQKNGISLKRPNVRPKHLIDCLKDPVHYEFLHRFAKDMIREYIQLDYSHPQPVPISAENKLGCM